MASKRLEWRSYGKWIHSRYSLAADGIRTVADVLARAELVRDLPTRSNHRLRAGGLFVHVKRTKGAVRSAEAAILARARTAGVPTATMAFEGADSEHGALVGTLDLGPAEPLDDLLRGGRVPSRLRRPLLAGLASAVARLHDAGLFPRDLYLNHVYADVSGPLPPPLRVAE